MDSVIADLRDYRERVLGLDPVKLWADIVQSHLPGVIFWTVDQMDRVRLSVGNGFNGLAGLEPGDATGTTLNQWTTLARELVATARRDGSVSRIAREVEGPTAGTTFLTCGVLHHSGDVVLMTVDLTTVREGRDAIRFDRRE